MGKTYKKNIEAELARKQIQNKRFHQKVKGSDKIYNRKKISFRDFVNNRSEDEDEEENE